MRMKRWMTALLALAVLTLAAGCGAGPAANENPFADTALTQVLEDVYAGASVEIPSLITTEITAENEQAFLGTTGLDFKEAIASEPAISSIAYSVCLVRMNEGADMEAAKQAIKDNVDPVKWICVQVDPSNVIVDSAGDVIILIMSNDYATSIHESFTALSSK